MAFHNGRHQEVAAHYPELMKAALAFSALTSLVFVIAACASNSWVYATYEYKDGRDKDEHAYQGVFVWENSHKIGNLKCSNLSTEQCNYLGGAQASMVLMLVASILAALVYFYILAGRASLFSPLAIFAQCLAGAEAVFGIMALSIYAQFKDDYYSTDDENMEYPVSFDAKYDGAWAVLVTATVISSLMCIGGSVYMSVYSSRKAKLDDYDDQQALNP